MTTPNNDSTSSPDAKEDVQSDPAAAPEGNDWSSEGGATKAGPATDDQRTDNG